MVIGPDTAREARQEDHDEIEALLRAAFDSDSEAKLVRQLRADGDIWHEVIKPWNGKIAGYYALSRMRAPDNWACLAPMAVRPEWQGGALAEGLPSKKNAGPDKEVYRRSWRIGSRMMEELASLMSSPRPLLHPECVVVLGKPSFYSRAGFSSERARWLTSPYPLSHTLILKRGDDVPVETLIYPRAFESLA